MKLFHFRDEVFGIKSLKERRLKIARIHELNDPFELLGCVLSDERKRNEFQSLKVSISNYYGFLCFSKNWQNPVQWSHYSNNHKGICLGFEIPNEFLIKITYQAKRLNHPKEYDNEFMGKVLSTKFSHWKYEKEYRLFVNLDQVEEENGLYFNRFSEDLKLTNVIVGCNSTLSRKDIHKALGQLSDKVEISKCRPAFKTFSIVKNKNERLWT